MRGRYLLVAALVLVFLLTELALGARVSNWDFLDDPIYMQASAKVLEGQGCHLNGLFPTVCNYEHPPLVKVLEAVSLYAFGSVVPRSTISNPAFAGDLPNLSSSILWFISFRFFQIVMGALSIALTYVIAIKISKNVNLAVLAAVLLALEPMYAFFARTAYLDIPMIFLALSAYAAYFSSVRLGPISENWIAGVLIGLSVLSKETGVVFIVPLLLYHLAFGDTSWRCKIKGGLAMISGSTLVFVGGLQLYDTFAMTPFTNALGQLAYMFAVSGSIACRGLCTFPPSPLGWFFFFTQSYWFGGLSNNPFLLWLVLAWIPLGALLLWRSRRDEASPETRLFVLALLLFASTFLENELIYLNRGLLDWYYLTIVPSLALGGAYLLTRKLVPRWAKVIIVGLLVAGYFWAYLIGPNLLAYE